MKDSSMKWLWELRSTNDWIDSGACEQKIVQHLVMEMQTTEQARWGGGVSQAQTRGVST